jgi:transcriptional regulator of aromatic amino acid metabolism
MSEIEIGFECTRAKPGYWDVREALEDAILAINMKDVVDRATKKMTRRKATPDQIKRMNDKMKQYVTDPDFCPVEKIVELDTAECKGDDKKVTGKIELKEGILEDLNMQESEILVGAVGRALEDAQFLKELPTEGDTKGEMFSTGRVMKRLTKWNIKTE